MAQLNFDPRRVEPGQVFEPIPTSWYTGQIIESEMKENSNKNGHYLELKCQVLGGDYNGRTVYDRLNLDNPNNQAVDIAYRTLSAICHAVGLGQQEIQDSQVLHGRPFLFKVNQRPARTDPTTGTRYEASNEVKGYKAIDPTAAPVLGPSKAQQTGFAGAQYGSPGGSPGQGFPGQGAQPSPAGWGAQPQPNAAPNGWGQPQPAMNGAPNGAAGWGQQPQGQQFAPQGFAAPPQQQPQPQYQTNPVNPATPPAYAQQQVPQAQPQPQPQQSQPPQQAYQNPGTQPQSNVGNPALAAGTPPPWAQQQPVAPGNGAPPPWVKQ